MGVIAGQGGTVVVGGEAGIGKSALLEWLTSAAGRTSACILTSGCYDLAPTPAYGPWLEILDGVKSCDQLPALPDKLQFLEDISAIDSQPALFELIAGYFAEAAESAPLVLVLEDLQWADSASLELLRYVSRAVTRYPALLVVSYRNDPDAESSFSRVLPALVREGNVRRLMLQPLDHEATGTLLRQRYRLSEEDEARLVGHLMRQTGGNPFFILELVQMLREQRLLAPAAGGWQLGDLVDSGVPPLIQQIVRERLSPLDDRSRGLLDLAAIFGFEVSLEMLEDLFHGTGDDLDAALQKAFEHRFLNLNSGRQSVRFSHAIVRETIYSEVPPVRRRRVHRQIGDILAERAQPDIDSVAEHLYQAGDELAIDWLVRAGEQGQRLFAPETVLVRCAQAIELASRLGIVPPVNAYRLQGLARETTGDLGGAREAQETALSLARQQGDQQAEWQALVDLGACWASRDYRRTLEYFEQALELARRSEDPEILAQSLNRLGNWLVNVGEPESGLEYHQEALTLFERAGDRAGTAATLDLAAIACLLRGDPVRSIEYYNRAIPILRAMDDRHTLATALAASEVARLGTGHGAFVPNVQRSEPGEPYRGFDEALKIASDIRWRAGEAFCLALRSRTAQMFGDFERALTDGREAAEIAVTIGHTQWEVLARCSLGTIWADLQDPDLAMSEFQRASDLAAETGSTFMLGIAMSSLAETALEFGDPDRAEALIAPRIDLSRPAASSAQLNYWFVMAETQLARGDATRALELLDDLEDALPGPDDTHSPQLAKLRGETLYAAGLLEDAEAVLSHASEDASTVGYRPLAWRILVILADLHLARGRSEDARSMLMKAGGLIDDLSAGIADDARRDRFRTQALARFPRIPGGPERSGSDQSAGGLSRREREVLRLVAEGLTDVEVSKRLYISSRTVSQHLRSIYTKLDVTNRTAAVRVAADRALI